MRTVKSLLMPIILSLMLSGCTALQVSERMFVRMMGLSNDNGIYELSLQVIDTQSADADTAANTASSPGYRYLSARGRNLSEAVSAVETDEGRQLFFGHCSLLVMDESSVFDRHLLMTLTERKISPGCAVVYAADPAAVLSRTDSDGRVVGADSVEGELDRCRQYGLYREMPLKDLPGNGESDTTVVLPRFEDTLAGTAAVSADGRIMSMNMAQTAVYNMINGETGGQLYVNGGCLKTDRVEVSRYIRQTAAGNILTLTLAADCTLTESGYGGTLSDYEKQAETALSAAVTELCGYAGENGFADSVAGADAQTFNCTADVTIS